MRKLPGRPSPAMIVALIALFVALSSGSYAAVKISPKDFKRGAVNSRAIANNTIRSGDVRNGDITGQDVKDNSLGNADIDNSNLQADAAKSATSAGNADLLDGIESSAFARGACGVHNGAIHGYARIIASSIFSSSFTTTDIESPYNCSGQTVEARRTGLGFYEIRFNGNPASLAMATNMQAPSVSPSNMNISLSRSGTGTFAATIETNTGTQTDWPFVIMVL